MTTNIGEINTRGKSEKPKKQKKAQQIFREGCGGLGGSKCLVSGTNNRRSADV